MLAVVKNAATTFLLPPPLVCLENWQPVEFYLEFTNSQDSTQTKGFSLPYILTGYNGYQFTFTEAATDDLPNQAVNLGNVGDQWDMRLYQSNGVDLTAEYLMLERVQIYASI